LSKIGAPALGILESHSASKGKAGKTASSGASVGKGFANAIASFGGGKDGGHSARTGSKLSISTETPQTAGAGEQAGGRVKIGHGTAMLAAKADDNSSDVTDGNEKPADAASEFLNAAIAKAPALLRTEQKEEKQPDEPNGVDALEESVGKADEPNDGDAGEESVGKADVGQLLSLLSAAGTFADVGMPVTAQASAARSGIDGLPRDRQGAPEAKTGKTDARADTTARLAGDNASATEGGEMPASDADQLFRLVRSDGKGREVDMTISGNGDTATFRDASTTGAKGEAVAVLDSRRYLGLAQTGNSAAVTAAIAQDPEWASSLTSTSALHGPEASVGGKVVNTLKIQMNPIELGLVTATLRLSGDELVVTLQVETGEAYRQLKDDQDTIVRALRGQGFAVDQVSVQLSPVDRSASSGQQGDASSGQQQFTNQQQAREGGSGRQDDGRQTSGNFGREGNSHDGSTIDSGNSVSGGRSVGSGSVYL
jgi:chemotaxis protein MotD